MRSCTRHEGWTSLSDTLLHEGAVPPLADVLTVVAVPATVPADEERQGHEDRDGDDEPEPLGAEHPRYRRLLSNVV